MHSLMLLGLLALNFAISWWNCYAVGGMWVESKAIGGWTRLVAWSAAAQSAIGFSSVILFALGGIGYATGHLPPRALSAGASLWYLLIILPVIGTGLVLTIHSWIIAYRERDLMSMGTAAWNTFAQAKNLYDAIDGVPQAFGQVMSFFKTDEDDDAQSQLMALVVVIVAASLLGGVILTYALIRKYAGRLPAPVRA